MEKDKEGELDYGTCFGCGRILPLWYLTQIRWHECHKTDFHHKLLCRVCKKNADEGVGKSKKEKK